MRLPILPYGQFQKLNQSAESAKELVKPIDFIFSKKIFRDIPITITAGKHGWVGPERSLHIKDEISVMTQLHEAFHYFMCEPERLRFDDFGLGWGSESFGLEAVKRETSPWLAKAEEEAVCVLTICAAKQLRIPMHAIINEMNYASMGDATQDEYTSNIEFIKSRNLECFGFKIEFPPIG